MAPAASEPDAFPYYACATCPWFHRKGKVCCGFPGKPRLTYDALLIIRHLLRRAAHDVRSTSETLDPEIREGLLGLWGEGRRGVVVWLGGERKDRGVGDKEGREGGRGRDRGVGHREEEEEEETLGDAEWEAKFLEVGEMVEMYLRMRGATEKERGGEPVLRKSLMERAAEEKGREISGRREEVEKRVGKMEARDECGAGWMGRFEEIRAMRELEGEVERERGLRG